MAVGEDSLKYDKILVWYKELMGITEDVPTRRSIKSSSTELERKVQRGSNKNLKRKDTLFHRRHGRRKSSNYSQRDKGTVGMSADARDLYLKIARGRTPSPSSKGGDTRKLGRGSRTGSSASPSSKRRARRSMRKSRSVASGVRR